MKTKFTRRLTAAALILGLFCVSALAADAIKTQMIEANYMGIKVVVNGIEVTPKDAAGHEVEPFTSNGTTYLPVRAVAAALGQDVEWDGATKTVYIGDNIPGKETNWMQKLPPYQLNHAEAYDGSDHKQFFTVAGKDQPLGIVMSCRAGYDSSGENGYVEYLGSAIWNTDLQYKTMNVTIGHMGNGQSDCSMEVYLDGVYSQTITLPWAAAPKTYSIPLNYSPNVRLDLIPGDTSVGTGAANYATFQYGLYNISFE